MKIVGERMRKLRESVNLSQSRMAKTFQVGQSSIFRYESGEASPSCELLMKYADYFDVSLDYIFGRTDDPHGASYEAKPKIEQSYPEMDKFIEMCFDPASPMNAKLKESLRRMLKEDSK
jgi:transcriptional regulator with XRE-family HTH domain